VQHTQLDDKPELVNSISAREALTAVQRWLRAPVTITGEVLGAALVGVVRATVPQAADAEAWGRFAAEQPALARVVQATWMDRIVVSPWAVATFGLSALSLWIVFLEVTRRAARRWGTLPTERSFASAPFSALVERPAEPTGPHRTVAVRGRLGSCTPGSCSSSWPAW
jgi:hypothetical protein